MKSHHYLTIGLVLVALVALWYFYGGGSNTLSTSGS